MNVGRGRVGFTWDGVTKQLRFFGLWITHCRNNPKTGETVNREGWTVWFRQTRLV